MTFSVFHGPCTYANRDDNAITIIDCSGIFTKPTYVYEYEHYVYESVHDHSRQNRMQSAVSVESSIGVSSPILIFL